MKNTWLQQNILSASSRLSIGIFWLLCTMVFAYIVLSACVFEDAYITFRVVDNFVNGYGLRWNIDERVQAYTHPLWMLLHIPVYVLFGNIYLGTIGISIVLGTLAVFLLSKLTNGSRTSAALLVILPLALSRTFRNYVICGLENPLSFCLLAWILLELLQDKQRFNYYRLCFAASLCIITRFDNIFIILPVLAWISWAERSHIHIGKLCLALSPALAWYGFSLFYYGFFFPNTKYAKIHTGISQLSSIKQGLYYFFNFIGSDPIGFCWSCAGILFALQRLPATLRNRFLVSDKDTRVFLIGVGCLLNVAYIVAVGGDFMPTRFFANVVIVSVGLIAFIKPIKIMKDAVFVAVCLLVIVYTDHSIVQPSLPDRTDHTLNGGIDDQHDYFYPTTGLLSDKNHLFRREPEHKWIDMGKALGVEAGGKPMVVELGNIGMKFFYAGPQIIEIDIVGLSDALLARLPTSNTKRWRIGHVLRDLPEGYMEARRTGDTSKMDPQLAQYYAKLRLVTSGDLLSWERLKTIIGFQLGSYDAWRDAYVQKNRVLK